eukprot:CAMPEP_0204429156 /NCGR_PEP_ID=MMETSP0470-20130426/59580_1 /ASSEMBLY_ACC=CAM_ASM_000385 /TAXON_ID=2969 /ORGANISM="Oxyrrhis marina" /LENGTH=41 /DNA_ID= /DNA_START= /DNA_END= /DNA_ORIENTATION=
MKITAEHCVSSNVGIVQGEVRRLLGNSTDEGAILNLKQNFT